MKSIRYAIEAVALQLAFFIFRIMPPDMASNIGGFLARTIGPRLAATRKARRNFQMALPDMADQTEQVMADMWDNLGRVFAEYPHLKTLAKAEHTTYEGEEHLAKAIEEKGSFIIFGAHYGNWEVPVPAYKEQYGVAVCPVYREPNNPKAAKLLEKCRRTSDDIVPIPKSRSGGRQLLETLKARKSVGILIDQKYNEGVAIPFFDHNAMTSPAFVQLAQKLDIPLLFGRVDRVEKTKFRVTIDPALDIKDKSVEEVMHEAHAILEKYIRARPGHWLWLHRRWSENAGEGK